jgi:hypothetical protein
MPLPYPSEFWEEEIEPNVLRNIARATIFQILPLPNKSNVTDPKCGRESPRKAANLEDRSSGLPRHDLGRKLEVISYGDEPEAARLAC